MVNLFYSFWQELSGLVFNGYIQGSDRTAFRKCVDLHEMQRKNARWRRQKAKQMQEMRRTKAEAQAQGQKGLN